MNLTDDDVIKIIKLVEESNFDTLQLECGDFKLTASKSGYSHSSRLELEQPLHWATSVVDSLAQSPTDQFSEQAPAKKNVSAPQASASKAVEEEVLVAIKAPMVGIFYCAPEPGAKPFVSVGTKIDEDTTVGLIEVMKVFSSVAARVKGIITKCLVENAQLVEYGQTLFLVRPDEEAK